MTPTELPANAPQAPTVTVIIPSYNHAAYLRECIDSVLAQDYAPIEVVVVDDGSTDGSMDILRGFGDRIAVIEQRGGRQARARNLALAASRGELVAFVDSDDRFCPGRLRAAVQALVAAPDVDVAWCDFRIIDDAGRPTAEFRWRPREADFRLELIAGNPICNAAVTVRRSALERIGGFDERIPRACDGAAWYQIAGTGGRFHHIDAIGIDYRVHASNDSGRFVLMAKDRDIALTDAARTYLRNGVVSTVAQKRWLRTRLLRQFAFRAAAEANDALPAGPVVRLAGRALRALGSDPVLAALAVAQRWRRRWRAAA